MKGGGSAGGELRPCRPRSRSCFSATGTLGREPGREVKSSDLVLAAGLAPRRRRSAGRGMSAGVGWEAAESFRAEPRRLRSSAPSDPSVTTGPAGRSLRRRAARPRVRMAAPAEGHVAWGEAGFLRA